MNFPLFIARHIIGSKTGGRQASQPAVRIATIGVAAGLAVMIITVCVVLGFKHTIRDKVVGFGSNITVANYMTLGTGEEYPIAIGDSMMTALRHLPDITHVQRYTITQGILKTDNDFLGVNLKGVDEDFDSTFISQNLKSGHLPHFSSKASHNVIVISQSIADKLGLKAGDRVFAYFINEQGVRMRRFKIAAIYATNLMQYDETTCFTDAYTAQHLNGWQADQWGGAELTVGNFDRLDEIADKVVDNVNKRQDHYGEIYSSRTVTEMNPQIFAWLDLMDLNVWIILALMVAVAGVTMISGLLIIILERTQMIGILKALGARNRQIRHTFLWLSSFIIGRGLIIGDIIGIGLMLLQQLTGFVKLDPQTYYVSEVPVEISIPLIIALNIATMIICVVVLVAPSYLISHIHPAKSMHYE